MFIVNQKQLFKENRLGKETDSLSVWIQSSAMTYCMPHLPQQQHPVCALCWVCDLARNDVEFLHRTATWFNPRDKHEIPTMYPAAKVTGTQGTQKRKTGLGVKIIK